MDSKAGSPVSYQILLVDDDKELLKMDYLCSL